METINKIILVAEIIFIAFYTYKIYCKQYNGHKTTHTKKGVTLISNDYLTIISMILYQLADDNIITKLTVKKLFIPTRKVFVVYMQKSEIKNYNYYLNRALQNEDFEQAAKLRDKINGNEDELKKAFEKQLLQQQQLIEDFFDCIIKLTPKE